MLKEALDEISGKYKYVIIDSPPSITYETIQVLRCSDYVYVPIQPTPLDLMATIPFLNLAKNIKCQNMLR